MTLTSRPACPADVPVLLPLIAAATAELQRAYLDDDQIRSSQAIMGLDTQLIDDGTYFVVESDGELAGCGGWSRRATLYGGDHSAGRDAVVEHLTDDSGGVPVPLVRMRKHL